jgi:protein-L-isoaspartate(D-aspartate) O-methyltransferase
MDTQTESQSQSNQEAIADPQDEIRRLKKQNDDLKKELEKLVVENKKLREVEDEAELKDKEIELLKLELEEVRKEKDEIVENLSGGQKKLRYEPVNNPLQTALVNYLMDAGVIKTKDIEEIMKSIDRGDFAPTDPYVDRPQPIGYNTTISAPHMHAVQLELLKDCFKNAKKALDIGTGSGFVALCLSKMMRCEGSKTYAVDHIGKIIELAKENISKNHKDYVVDGRLEFVVADGRKGLPEYAPYDVIFVGGAVSEMPDELVEQLAPGGSMLIPVGEFTQQLIIVHKTRDEEIVKKPVMSVMFGRLQSAREQCPDLIE